MVETCGAAQSEINSILVGMNNEKDQDISFTFLGPVPTIFLKLSFVNRHPIQPGKSETRNLNADTSRSRI